MWFGYSRSHMSFKLMCAERCDKTNCHLHVLLAGLLLYLWRQAPIITHFAIASVAARFWTYHSNYDNVIVAFLLLALGYLAWNRKAWYYGLHFFWLAWVSGFQLNLPTMEYLGYSKCLSGRFVCRFYVQQRIILHHSPAFKDRMMNCTIHGRRL